MITIRYTCGQCGIKDREVQVPARATADYPVTAWMKDVTYHLRDDHSATSPQCKATSISDVKVPMPEGGEFIGQQVE